MREIKFRQWRPEYKAWHYFEFTDGMCSGVINVTLSVYPIMQFTGLHDKNGKEIYEGDIVKTLEDYFDDTIILKVEWLNSSCGFEPFSDSKKNCGCCGVGLDEKECEVIGNIYENPELIGVK